MSCPEDLVAHMRRVLVAERDLHDLGVVWRLIESSAAISCPAEAAAILPTLIGTRERFDALHHRLTEQMADETQAELADELSAKAQCAIDILVRNLYERTADVGFLAVDEAVRAFCAADAGAQASERAAMRQRLTDYQRKYSVYDDVLLCAPDGTVLARLDDVGGDHPLHTSREPLIAQALSASGFCERFGPSDLAAPGQPATLLYAHRVLGPEGQVAGVLVLRFRFEDEMARIFADVAGERPQIALMLVDAQQRVIASSDPAHVPLGARMVLAASAEPGMQLTQFAGREYLGLHCAGAAYQGYPGPAGWRAVAMVSLLTAFTGRRDAGQADTGDGADGAVSQGRLAAIRDDADAINRELRRVVWNGRLMARAQTGDRLRLTAVLRQVSAAGVRTQTRVNQAIGEIGATALARGRQRARDMARLAADILDRNLYERANDCRWWALSPLLRETLASGEAASRGTALNALLNHINGLYTVYSRLVAFDGEGRICGASAGPAGTDAPDELLGQAVPAEMLAAVRGLPDAQRYAATAFEDSAWHAQGATYTYLAAVRDPANDSRIVGGVAIVFNAARELRAILDDILGGREGLAAFVDADGRVLCATEGFDTALLGFGGAQGVVEHAGQRYLLARVAGGGYREFKRDDGYDNGVQAVVGLALGTVERRRSGAGHAELRPAALPSRAVAADAAPLEELALFSVGGGCFALPAHRVIEASPNRGLVRTPTGGAAGLGLLDVQGPTGSHLVQVLCARRLLGVQRPARAGDGVVLVLNAEGMDGAPMRVGLQVDTVLSVLEMDPRHYHPAPTGFQSFAPWVTGLAECQRESDGSAQLVQRLDVHALLRAAGLPAQAAAEAPGQPTGDSSPGLGTDASQDAVVTAATAVSAA